MCERERERERERAKEKEYTNFFPSTWLYSLMVTLLPAFRSRRVLAIKAWSNAAEFGR